MRLLFCTSKLPGALAIRAVTWSDWSHVAIIDGDEVIEATFPQGVRVAPLADVLAKHSKYAIVDFDCASEAAIIAAARGQLGKPYDWTALAGMLVHRDWQENDSWFCSELVAFAFDAAGHPLFRPDANARITPQHLWMLSPNCYHAN